MRWSLAIGSALVAAAGTACTSAARTVTGTGTYASIVPHSVEVTPTCTTAQLAPSLVALSSAASQNYTMIRFQNRGVPCTAGGAPDVALLDSHHRPVQPAAEQLTGRIGQGDAPSPSLLMVTGTVANSVIGTSNTEAPSPGLCDPTTPAYLRVRAPGATDAVELPWPGSAVCRKDFLVVDAIIHGDEANLF